MARHPRRDVCQSSSRAGCGCADQAYRFPARVSSCFQKEGRDRLPGKASEHRCAWGRLNKVTRLQMLHCYIGQGYENGQFSDVTFVTLLTFVTFLFDNLERGALTVTR